MANLKEMLSVGGTMEQAEMIARRLVVEKGNEYLLDLQLLLNAQGKIEEARVASDALVAEFPENNRVAFNRGWHLMHDGDLLAGFSQIERGRLEGVFGSPAPFTEKPKWNGEDLGGKKVLLYGEGGLGDQLINARFAKVLADRGAEVIASADKGLHGLIGRIEGVSHVIAHDAINKAVFDYWIPAMTAAYYLGIDFEHLPRKPYLTTHPIYQQKWGAIVRTPATAGKFRVGIRWLGNQQFEHEQFRRFPTDPLFALSAIPNTQFYSLQKDADTSGLPGSVIDLAPWFATWEDTAAAIMELDLVITSCTSVAHLSAALGKETWVIVPVMPYYIWALPGEKSPWYDTVTVFRQKSFNNWTTPLMRVRERLFERLGVSTRAPAPSLA